jgi:phosphohistidine phosphatase SixA
MHLILIRHAERETLPQVADSQQVLTAKGLRTAKILGEYLLAINLPATTKFYSSDYLRATQTAAQINTALGNKLQIQTKECLRTDGDGDLPEILELVKANSQQDWVLLVGHKPELEQVGAYFTGRPLPLKKAEAASIAIPDTSNWIGRIEWRYHAK